MLTIITVTFNDLDNLKKTLKSILSSPESNFELIVIDGNSKDGTTDYLLSINDSRLKSISEPDKGIYDAMNKGITMAKGNWVVFMNGGDQFLNTATLSRVLDACNNESDFDVLSSDHVVAYQASKWLSETKDLKKINKGMVFCHQASIIKSSLLRDNPYDLQYKIASDYNLFISLYLKGAKFKKIDFPIALVSAAGVSDTYRFKTMMDYRKVQKNHGILKAYGLDLITIGLWLQFKVEVRDKIFRKSIRMKKSYNSIFSSN